MPAISATARTEVPAMMPVPSEAGISLTRAEQNSPITSCGIEPSLVIGHALQVLAAVLVGLLDGVRDLRALPKP